MGLHNLHIAVGDSMVPMAYHHALNDQTDVFEVPGCDARYQYYGGSGTPQVWFDGTIRQLGGSHTNPTNYWPYYNQRIAVDSPVTMTIELQTYNPGNGIGTVRATVTNVSDTDVTGCIHLNTTGDDTAYTWQNQTHLYYTVLEVDFGDTTCFTLSPGEVAELSDQTFTLNTGWRDRSCTVVGFFQDPANRHIHQGALLHGITNSLVGEIAYVEAAYDIGSGYVAVDTVVVSVADTIGNLRFYPMPVLIMPRDTLAFHDARSFCMQGQLINDDELSPEFESQPFVPDAGSRFPITCRWRILTPDANPSDNTMTVSDEVWTADFQYGQDNYEFKNYSIPDNFGWILGEGLAYIYDWQGYIPHRTLLAVSEAYAATGGHCYGFTSSAILYSEHPEWIPGGGGSTYDLLESDFQVLNNIRDCHAMLVAPFADAIYRSIAYDLTTNSTFALNTAQTLLESNTLVNACYNGHAVTAHTVVKEGQDHWLYAYDNAIEAANGASLVGLFRDVGGDSVVLDNSVWPHIMTFHHPEFALPTRSAALDSLMAWEVDSLVTLSQNMLVYSEYNPEDSSDVSIADLAISAGVTDCRDYGSYKVFYLDNAAHPDISISANRTGSFSLMGVTTTAGSRETCTQFVFAVITMMSDSTQAVITSAFQPGDQVCSVDFDADGMADAQLVNSYNGQIVPTSNLPPGLITPPPVVMFAMNIGSVQLNLLDYVGDEDPASLVFGLSGVPFPVSAAIEDSLMNLALVEPFEGILNLTIHVSDGTNSVTVPLFMEYSPCFYSDYDIPPLNTGAGR